MEGKLFDQYVYPVFNAKGVVSRIAIFAHDITQRARAEEEKAHLESQLRQSQKMEAIGTLAGGIAHDFNNILTAIIGYGSLLQMNMEAGDPRKIYADHILSSSQKAAALTQSLLAFGRKQVIELKPRKVSEVVREAEELLKRLLTEDIEFRVVRGASDMVVRADITQIAQVLMNLVTNARDAMPKGGKLTLETKAVSLGNEFIQVHGFGEAGDYAAISVTDTGIGMDHKTREKIFEPFFTTKEVGKGTGLGLSIVYGIIKQHNGYINVISEPGSGTTFVIYLPVVKTRVKEISGVREEIRGGDETILVAEDNDEVRRLAKEILTSRGYTVIESVDGEDAIRRFAEHKDEIDLLLLDVVMPRMNGKETHEAIKKTNPLVKVLFTSGYTGDVVLDKGVHDESINFISKPLSPDELLWKVREVLDKPKDP
jgi:signal transduction histidine kinase/CheY-like chemotaxis protein